MSTRRGFVIVAVTVLMMSPAASGPALAQERHVVSAAELRQAMAELARAQDQTRASLRGVLRHPQVREVAKQLGLDVVRADRAVATLTSAELERLAEPTRELSAELAGGNALAGLGFLVLVVASLVLIVGLVVWTSAS